MAFWHKSDTCKCYLKCDGFVGFSSKQEVLPGLVWRLNPLLIGGHEPVPRP